MARILIVEDEKLIGDLICEGLSAAGYKCLYAEEGQEALRLLQEQGADLVILDVMLPGMTGFELMGQMGKVPVIFVTAKSDLRDCLKGLDLGADDYLVKPFEMPELLARVRAVLRRTNKEERYFPLDDLLIDLDARRVFKDGKEIRLTGKEFAVLDTFITNRNSLLTRDQILDLVWGYDYEGETSHIIDVYVQQLRKKLGLKDRIRAVYGVGYRLEL